MSKFICSEAKARCCGNCDHAVPHNPYASFGVNENGKKIKICDCTTEWDRCDFAKSPTRCVECNNDTINIYYHNGD